MTSGIEENENAMYPTDDWIKFYLDQHLVADPVETFSKATSDYLLTRCLNKAESFAD